jgi:hypothetical protein
MNKSPLRAAALAALLAGGCASAPPPAPPAPPAAPPPPAPPPLPAPEIPQAVYRNPRIGMVLLRAHQDAEGRLLGPQVMYQVVDPGGWNLAALDRGGGYLPAANALGPPEAPTAPGILVTGRMRPEERPQAEAEAARQGPGWTALYDPQVGWLLLPPPQKPPE